jgi:putative transcriptional regulator
MDSAAIDMDREIFEHLLETSRALRRKRRERLARLILPAGRRRRAHGDAAESVDVRAIRAVTGLSQAKFAELLGIELATLRNWEQGRRAPTGPARALLRAIRRNPVDVIKALTD